jgi:hypothetical protein
MIVVSAPFGAFVAVEALITPGDAGRTTQDILGSEGLFRWGIASLILVVILDIVMAAAPLTLFMPVSPSPLHHGRLVSTRLCGGLPGGDQPARPRLGDGPQGNPSSWSLRMPRIGRTSSAG